MKSNRHTLLAKGILVLLSLAVLIFAFTYSWYTDTPKATASGITGYVEATGDFEYAIGFYNNGTAGNYKMTPFTNQTSALNLESLTATDGGTYNLLHDYKPIDVTGDGRTLIRPSMSYGNKEIDEASIDYSVAEPNVQYISFDLYFRSTVPGTPIKLGNGSWAKGGCEVTSGGVMKGANATNISSYGNFSRDAIVGAVRIAFIPYDYSSELSNIPATLAAYEDNTPEYLHNRAMFVWLPRPELHLNSNNGLTGWTLTNNSTDVNDKTHKYYNIFNCVPAKTVAEGGIPSTDPSYHTTVAYDNTITPASLSASSQEFTSIGSSVSFVENGTTYYYTKVNVRIWVEGTDLESRRATSGGKFEVNFKFTTT